VNVAEGSLAGGAGRSIDPRRRTFWFLSLPAATALGLFLVLPLIFMVALSFRPDLTGQLLAPFSPTLEHYQKVAETGSYWNLLFLSTVIALGVAAVAVLAAYPLAYFLAFRAGKRAGLYLILLLVPFWTSYLLRVMAWRLMLDTSGVLNSILTGLGLTAEPLDLLYNRFAVVVTLIYVWIPFAMLPMLAAMGRIDPRLQEAAADLYASPWQQLRRVTIPLSLPGVIAAFFMVFIPTVGEYVTPLLVGGAQGSMYGNIVQAFFIGSFNWPLGSALSVIMLGLTLVLVFIGLRVVQPRRLLAQ